MKKQSYSRKFVYLILISFLFFATGTILMIRSKIPGNIRLIAGKEQRFVYDFPTKSVVYEEAVAVNATKMDKLSTENLYISSTKPFTVLANQTGKYKISCKLFGFLQVKNIQVDVMDKKQYVRPGGTPIGIYMETAGVLAVGTGSVSGMDGLKYEPANHIIQSGDYILEINNEKVKTKKELIDFVNRNGPKEVILSVKRKQEIIQLQIKPIQTGKEEYKLGIWVRDNTQGIGTLTFVNENGEFGALGHGINDVDTNTLMELYTGKLYQSDIIDIVKGSKGNPGELTGVIHYGDEKQIGVIEENTPNGIYGKMKKEVVPQMTKEEMEICLKQDVKLGPATILSSIDGMVKEYQVEVKEIHLNDNDANKGLVIQVTDQELLEKTGGIVQGMSGSPILQEGKVIGAVTHVFVQDSTSGFGIFIENML